MSLKRLIVHPIAPASIPLPPNFGNPATPPHEHPHPVTHEGTGSESSHPRILGRGLEREYLTLTEPLPPWQARDGRDEDEERQQQEQRDAAEVERRRKSDSVVALGFPPRPVPGSVIDLDRVLERCDFQTSKVSPDRAWSWCSVLESVD